METIAGRLIIKMDRESNTHRTKRKEYVVTVSERRLEKLCIVCNNRCCLEHDFIIKYMVGLNVYYHSYENWNNIKQNENRKNSLDKHCIVGILFGVFLICVHLKIQMNWSMTI